MPHLTVRIFILSFATLAVLHILLLRFYLYWRHEWLDIPMHLFGGSIVALGVFAAGDLNVPFFKRLRRFMPVMLTVLFVAVVWEVYEYLIVYQMGENYVADTILDLLMGLTGGVIGLVVARRLQALTGAQT